MVEQNRKYVADACAAAQPDSFVANARACAAALAGIDLSAQTETQALLSPRQPKSGTTSGAEAASGATSSRPTSASFTRADRRDRTARSGSPPQRTTPAAHAAMPAGAATASAEGGRSAGCEWGLFDGPFGPGAPCSASNVSRAGTTGPGASAGAFAPGLRRSKSSCCHFSLVRPLSAPPTDRPAEDARSEARSAERVEHAAPSILAVARAPLVASSPSLSHGRAAAVRRAPRVVVPHGRWHGDPGVRWGDGAPERPSEGAERSAATQSSAAQEPDDDDRLFPGAHGSPAYSPAAYLRSRTAGSARAAAPLSVPLGGVREVAPAPPYSFPMRSEDRRSHGPSCGSPEPMDPYLLGSKVLRAGIGTVAGGVESPAPCAPRDRPRAQTAASTARRGSAALGEVANAKVRAAWTPAVATATCRAAWTPVAPANVMVRAAWGADGADDGYYSGGGADWHSEAGRGLAGFVGESQSATPTARNRAPALATVEEPSS